MNTKISPRKHEIASKLPLQLSISLFLVVVISGLLVVKDSGVTKSLSLQFSWLDFDIQCTCFFFGISVCGWIVDVTETRSSGNLLVTK